MIEKLKTALNKWEILLENWGAAPGRIEKKAPFAFVWHPTTKDKSLAKTLGLTLQAVTHGDEWGGIEVLLEVLEGLKLGHIAPEFSIGFVLGNPEASKQTRRYLEQDLNRSFGLVSPASKEGIRAKALEPILGDSQFFLDFHQTIEPTLRPFFIFPYTQPCFEFASALHRGLPIVTHWGAGFSKDGMCSDEFVNRCGGTGITLELGQKGFDVYHTAIGLQVALAAIQYVKKIRSDARASIAGEPEGSEIYTWKKVVGFEAGMVLEDGLVNFQELKAGQVIGMQMQGEIVVPSDGLLLFPKYSRDPQAAAPKEIYRILKPIKKSELGQQGVIGV